MSEQITREQILAMEPGSELDMLVAVNVFGCVPAFNSLPGYPRVKSENNLYSVPVEGYSSSVAAAWEAESVAIRDIGVTYAYRLAEVISGTVIPDIERLDDYITSCSDNLISLVHATPEQRCKAALLAVMDL